MKQPYSSLSALDDVVLEESWVLEVSARPGEVTFDMDLVMTTDHPDFRPPNPDELWATIRGLVVFSGVTALSWTGQGASPSRGADDVSDYGNIDAMTYDGDEYQLEGSWGEMRLNAKSVRIDYPSMIG